MSNHPHHAPRRRLLVAATSLALAALAAGLDWRLALVAGLALSQSSTAIALATLAG